MDLTKESIFVIMGADGDISYLHFKYLNLRWIVGKRVFI